MQCSIRAENVEHQASRSSRPLVTFTLVELEPTWESLCPSWHSFFCFYPPQPADECPLTGIAEVGVTIEVYIRNCALTRATVGTKAILRFTVTSILLRLLWFIRSQYVAFLYRNYHEALICCSFHAQRVQSTCFLRFVIHNDNTRRYGCLHLRGGFRIF